MEMTNATHVLADVASQVVLCAHRVYRGLPARGSGVETLRPTACGRARVPLDEQAS